MATAGASGVFHCPQCGGELHPDEGQIFLPCPYCGSAVHVDKSRLVFHWYLASTLDDAGAQAALARWMAGNETVKDLDRKARVIATTFAFFPVWYVRRKHDTEDETLIEPAAATSITELKSLRLPAGDLRRYDPFLDPQAVAPTVPLDTVLGWLAERGVARDDITEAALVHLPLYTFKYTYSGRTYTAVVEGATGGVVAHLFPAKAEAPYRAAGAAAAMTYLCLALIPLVAYASGDVEGLGLGMTVCAGLGLLAAPILFAFGVWVAAKV